MRKLTTCLMFVGDQHGRAEEAMAFYVSSFENSRVLEVERHGAGEDEPAGSVKRATFSLDGHEFMAMDSSRRHPFTFTPAISIFVRCDSEQELDELYATLSEEGTVLMPVQAYPFSARFGWVEDKFGVSWQLKLAGRDRDPNAGDASS